MFGHEMAQEREAELIRAAERHRLVTQARKARRAERRARRAPDHETAREAIGSTRTRTA